MNAPSAQPLPFAPDDALGDEALPYHLRLRLSKSSLIRGSFSVRVTPAWIAEHTFDLLRESNGIGPWRMSRLLTWAEARGADVRCALRDLENFEAMQSGLYACHACGVTIHVSSRRHCLDCFMPTMADPRQRAAELDAAIRRLQAARVALDLELEAIA